jgi:hypothetical protein
MSERFTEQTALNAYCRERLADQQQATRVIVSTVNVSMLTAPRPGGKWSIAAIFDHMAVMNRLYLQKLEPAIETAAPSGQRAWSPTLAGSLLRWAVNTRFKLPTAPLFKPPDLASDPEAITRFLDSHEELAVLLERCADVHWKSVRISSPASDLVRVNLGDVFLTLVEHTRRHLRQIDYAVLERRQ